MDRDLRARVTKHIDECRKLKLSWGSHAADAERGHLLCAATMHLEVVTSDYEGGFAGDGPILYLSCSRCADTRARTTVASNASKVTLEISYW